MKVVVDTSVWSLALRRNSPDGSSQSNDGLMVTLLRDWILDGRVVLLGAIRQEILSGIRHPAQYMKLRDYLRAFPNVELATEDYELAAEFYNTCRQKGIQGSNTDFLICAAACHRNYGILTTDHDFQNFKEHIPITLMEH
ncbi:MAG: PIN domain-containing protein [Gloeobacterales cyanobacterium]